MLGLLLRDLPLQLDDLLAQVHISLHHSVVVLKFEVCSLQLFCKLFDLAAFRLDQNCLSILEI